MPLRTPAITYGANTTLFPGAVPDVERDPDTPERQTHTASSGRALHYYIGPRNFIERAFQWQTDTLKAEWLTFWAAVKDGTIFWYSEDENMPKLGGALIKCGAGYKCGVHTIYATAIQTRAVTVDQEEFAIERGESDGTWIVNLRIREYV